MLPFLRLMISLLNYEVYYVEMNNKLNDIKIVNGLEKGGIKWIKKEYTDFSQYERGVYLAVEFADGIYEKVKLSYVNRCINEMLLTQADHKNKMDVIWKYYLFRIISTFAGQYAAAEYLLKTNNYEEVRIISFNSFAYLLRNILNNRMNIFILPGPFFLKDFSQLVKSTIKLILRKIRPAMINHDFNGISYDEHFVSKNVNLDDIEVIYFPHQGIFYGEMFNKDHFYNEDVKSPFHKSKVLHVSLGEKNEKYMLQNYQYYRENDIPFLDLHDLDYSKKKSC